jgi:hypothetical protein
MSRARRRGTPVALAAALASLLFPAFASAPNAHAAPSRGVTPLSGGVPGESFGCSVASAGDVNGDGYADVIIGAYQSGRVGQAVGRAYIYFGGLRPQNRPDVILTGEAAGDAFGVCVASAGDVNKDGYSDVIVGAYQNDARGANAGRAYVYFGGPKPHERPDIVLNGEAAGDAFGYAVASAGDVNHDGYADVIVGAYENSARGAGAGRAYVFFGGARPHDRPDVTLTGASAGDSFGFSVAGAGDANKDGFADVAVGAYHNGAGGKDAGRVYVYYGGKAPSETAGLVLTGEAAGDAFGYAVAAAGDANGDGFADLAVGAYGNDAGGSAAGRAYVFFGGPGADGVPDFTQTGEATLDNLGFAVGGAGDVDGDGYADLVVGAPYSDGDAGRGYLTRNIGGKSRPIAAR